MLAKYYRLHGVNNSGETMSFASGAEIAIRLSPYKITSGALAFTTTITEDLGFDATDTITDGSAVEGTVRDNTSNLDFGVKGVISVAHDVDAANGTFGLYLEESDDNTNWPNDETDWDPEINGRLLCVLPIDPSAADASTGKNFEF